MPIAAVMEKTIPIPEGVTVKLENCVLSVKGGKGTLTREFKDPKLQVVTEKDAIYVRANFPRIREKAMVGTWESHIKNMVKGTTEGYTYTMKIVYSHFPVKVTVKGDKVSIENFTGEKCPRYAKIVDGAKVSVKGDQVVVEGMNKECVGQTMANIEKATVIKGFDNRVFQDGIYLVKKE